MRRTVVMLFCFCTVCTASYADAVYLNNGTKIEGEIIERTAQQVKIKTLGVTLTYYIDEIESIEGAQPAATPVRTDSPAASDPLPATSPGMPTLPTLVEYQEPAAPLPPQASAADPSVLAMSKTDLILAYIEASGTKGNMMQAFTQIIEQESGEDTQILRELLNVDEIITRLIPVYDKYFSEDELRQLVTFYRSGPGRKLLEVTPLIMRDSADVSMQYFQEKAAE